ncbi:MAG: hypothetical protein ABEJ06_00480 [Haloarculaceae archaeon]
MRTGQKHLLELVVGLVCFGLALVLLGAVVVWSLTLTPGVVVWV